MALVNNLAQTQGSDQPCLQPCESPTGRSSGVDAVPSSNAEASSTDSEWTEVDGPSAGCRGLSKSLELPARSRRCSQDFSIEQCADQGQPASGVACWMSSCFVTSTGMKFFLALASATAQAHSKLSCSHRCVQSSQSLLWLAVLTSIKVL